MYKYVIKRLIATIPILFFVTFIIFTIMSFTPGDPGRLILGNFAPAEAVNQLNHKLGYDKPFFIQFGTYLSNLAHFDFGNSYRSGNSVVTEIMSRFPNTLKLTVSAIFVCSVVGVSIGILAAVKQYSFVDNSSTVFALFFASVPGFWLGLMLIYVFALKLHLLPTNGVSSWRSFVLPTITISLGGVGAMLRLTRSTMLETIRQDYIRTARAKGAPQKVIIWKHALKNALLPVITMIGMSFGGLLGGTVVVENIFSIPGLGSLLVDSIRTKDIPVVMGCTIFFSAMFCLIMLVVDILYAYVDPRIKAKYER